MTSSIDIKLNDRDEKVTKHSLRRMHFSADLNLHALSKITLMKNIWNRFI